MMRRAARLLVLASFLVSIGMHAAVLQAVAWAKMTVDFARHDAIAVSLEKTFDGRHPCPICLSLRKAGRSSSLASAPRGRLSFIPPTSSPRIAHAVLVWSVVAAPAGTFGRARAPASPPPKVVLS